MNPTSRPRPGVYPFWFWNGVQSEAIIREQLKEIQQQWLERAKEMRQEYKDRQAELAEKLKEYRELLDSVRSTTLRDAGDRTRRGDD